MSARVRPSSSQMRELLESIERAVNETVLPAVLAQVEERIEELALQTLETMGKVRIEEMARKTILDIIASNVGRQFRIVVDVEENTGVSEAA